MLLGVCECRFVCKIQYNIAGPDLRKSHTTETPFKIALYKRINPHANVRYCI